MLAFDFIVIHSIFCACVYYSSVSIIQQLLLSLLLFDGKVKLDATAILIVLLNAPEPMFKSDALAIWVQEHLFGTTESSSPKFHYKATNK